MSAALVVSDGVDFVDDHRPDSSQNFAASPSGQQDIERLGSGDQNVRWMCEHGAAFVRERVAGAHCSANLRHEHAALSRELQNFAQRTFQVLLNVVAESLEWRYVKNFGLIYQIAAQSLANQAIDADQKRRERFSRAGRRGNQCGFPGQNVWPALKLWLRGCSKSPNKPIAHERMRPFEACEV